MEIVSFARRGYDGELVKVEADLRRGIPAIDIVGLPDGAVREARERMRAAIRNSGLEFPRERILLNLCPASLRKEGSAFDLPIALAVLCASEGLLGSGRKVMVTGELELSGRVRPVSGVLAAVSAGISEGITRFIVPLGNREEAELAASGRVRAVETLAEAMGVIREAETEAVAEIPAGTAAGRETAAGGEKTGQGRAEPLRFPPYEESQGFEAVRGQDALVRALQIAAAGGHNLIVYGPPGCGKTMALRRFPSLLPDLDRKTALEVTRIHSIADLLGRDSPALMTRPPFREPHPNASLEGMTGGGARSIPGEISLAHGGVLFLDEAPQFRTTALQALRSPLESGEVTLSRAGRSVTFPSRFQLLLAANPCPCGNAGAPGRVCTCMSDAVERHWMRLTAPLLDRVDLRVEVRPPEAESLTGGAKHSTAKLRDGIERARRKQTERGQERANARLSGEALLRAAVLSPEARRVFSRAMEADSLSGRGGHALLRVARSVADISGEEVIAEDHLREAAGFRKWGIGVPDFL